MTIEKSFKNNNSNLYQGNVDLKYNYDDINNDYLERREINHYERNAKYKYLLRLFNKSIMTELINGAFEKRRRLISGFKIFRKRLIKNNKLQYNNDNILINKDIIDFNQYTKHLISPMSKSSQVYAAFKWISLTLGVEEAVHPFPWGKIGKIYDNSQINLDESIDCDDNHIGSALDLQTSISNDDNNRNRISNCSVRRIGGGPCHMSRFRTYILGRMYLPERSVPYFIHCCALMDVRQLKFVYKYWVDITQINKSIRINKRNKFLSKFFEQWKIWR
jgi:hypothetical protein